MASCVCGFEFFSGIERHAAECPISILTKERDAAILQIEGMKNALNKIHDLAGQVRGSDFLNTQMGAIQAWVHEVSPCGVKRIDEPECTCSIDGTPYCRARDTGYCKAQNPTR